MRDAWAARDGQPLRAMRTIAALFGRDSMHQPGHDAAAADADADRQRDPRREIGVSGARLIPCCSGIQLAPLASSF